jgi:hypothetical protein
MTEHVEPLREYAARAVKGNESLNQYEERVKAARLDRLFYAGASLGCTKKELIVLLLKRLLERRRGCDCFTCRARREARQPQ